MLHPHRSRLGAELFLAKWPRIVDDAVALGRMAQAAVDHRRQKLDDMSDYHDPSSELPAIELHNLGKRYYIGALHKRRVSSKEFLTNLMLQPMRRARAVIQGRDATNATEEFWALRNLTLTIKRGEALGIVGTNGSGKSTLLKLITRVAEPSEGYALTRGRLASMLEVGAALNPEMTGRENIYLNGIIMGMTREEIDAKFDEIVVFAGLQDFLETPVKRYSSGMRLRLAFSTSVQLVPEIFIIDEVLGVGDIAFMEKSVARIKEVIDSGTTVLVVSHFPRFINDLCTRAIWLDNGRLRAEGPARDISEAYQQEQGIDYSSPTAMFLNR